MAIQNSKKIPSGSAFDQGDTWLPLGKFRTLVCSKDFFETHGYGILAFTIAVFKEIFDQPCLNKDLVNALYTVEVIDTYGGPSGLEAIKLLSQLKFPLVQRFWEGRSFGAERNKPRSSQIRTEYCWRREAPRPGHAANGWVVLKNGINHVSVPKIGLIPLLALDLTEVENDIPPVNGMIIQEEEMRKIKKGILVGMYHASELEATKLADLMKTCDNDVATEAQPTATDTKVGSNETCQDPTSSKQSETSIIQHLVPRSGDEDHKRRRAKRHSIAVIDHGSHHQGPSSATASEIPDTEIGEAVGDASGQDTQGLLALHRKVIDSAT